MFDNYEKDSANARELAEMSKGLNFKHTLADSEEKCIIGDYYGACVYIAGDGKILAFHDYEKMKMHVFGSLEETLLYARLRKNGEVVFVLC